MTNTLHRPKLRQPFVIHRISYDEIKETREEYWTYAVYLGKSQSSRGGYDRYLHIHIVIHTDGTVEFSEKVEDSSFYGYHNDYGHGEMYRVYSIRDEDTWSDGIKVMDHLKRFNILDGKGLVKEELIRNQYLKGKAINQRRIEKERPIKERVWQKCSA